MLRSPSPEMAKTRKSKKTNASSSPIDTGCSVPIGKSISAGEAGSSGARSGIQAPVTKQSVEDADNVFDEMCEPDISCTLGDEDTVETVSAEKHKKLGEEEASNPSWADRVKAGLPTRVVVDEELCAFNLEDEDDNSILIEDEDVLQGKKTWGFNLIGYLVGKFPGRQALMKCCMEWGVRFQYAPHESQWLVFQFETDEDRRKVLEGGPYFVYNKPLILKVMPEFFDFSDDELHSVPLWVQLRNLPLELWGNNSLSKILSRIGRPLRMDSRTASRSVVSYARALVEVDVSKVMLKKLKVKLRNGMSFQVDVWYENIPDFCMNCMGVGHKTSSCKEKKNHKRNCVNSVNVQQSVNTPLANRVMAGVPDNEGGGNPLGANVQDNQVVEEKAEPVGANDETQVVPSKEDVVHDNLGNGNLVINDDGFFPVVTRGRSRKFRDGHNASRGKSMDKRDVVSGQIGAGTIEHANHVFLQKQVRGKGTVNPGDGALRPSRA